MKWTIFSSVIRFLMLTMPKKKIIIHKSSDLSTNSFLHSLIYSLIHYFFILSWNNYLSTPTNYFIHSLIHSFTHLFITSIFMTLYSFLLLPSLPYSLTHLLHSYLLPLTLPFTPFLYHSLTHFILILSWVSPVCIVVGQVKKGHLCQRVDQLLAVCMSNHLPIFLHQW